MVRGGTRVASIAGGFVLVPVSGLMQAWRACRSRPLGIGDFRAWLACREMVARRGSTGGGRPPSYGTDELAMLLGITGRRARASIRRLVGAGLIGWSEGAIGFPEAGPMPDGADPVSGSISGGRGSLAIPRRILRDLAGGARPALIATALGILLRCLGRRRSGWDGRGRVKASWVAAAFGVSVRAVKSARKGLVGLGWIRVEGSDQRGMNRWGARLRVDLGWESPGARSTPPRAPGRREIDTPSVDQDPLRDPDQDQEPGRGRPAGVRSGGETEGPTLRDIKPADLRETARLLELHRQAVERKLVGDSEHDRLKFVSAAEHARAIGERNPCGLFASLVRRGDWRYATQADEDAARRRLREHRRGSATHLGGLVVPRIEGPPPPGHCERESPGGHPDRPEAGADRPEVRGRDDPRPGPPARVGTFVPDRKEVGPTTLGEMLARLVRVGPA